MVILRSIKDVDDWNYDETAGEEDTKHEDWIRQFIVKWITTLFDLPEEDNGDKKKRLFSSYREELDIVTRNQISYQRMILMMTFRSITKRITMDGMTMMMISRLAISKRVILKITMTTMAMVSIWLNQIRCHWMLFKTPPQVSNVIEDDPDITDDQDDRYGFDDTPGNDSDDEYGNPGKNGNSDLKRIMWTLISKKFKTKTTIPKVSKPVMMV